MADEKDDKPKVAVFKDSANKQVTDAELRQVQGGGGFAGIKSMATFIFLFGAVFFCGALPLIAYVMWPETIVDGGRIAVLPFTGTLDDPALLDALTNELTGDLKKHPKLEVLPAADVAKYKTSTASLAEIGEELKVRFLVQGTVEAREAGALVLNVSLMNIEQHGQLFSRRYDADLTTALQVEDKVAAEIIEATGPRKPEPAKEGGH